MTGKSTKLKTNVVYRTLIYETPSDPSTVLTAIIVNERISNAAGEDLTILTSDQQLCRMMVEMTWSNSTR